MVTSEVWIGQRGSTRLVSGERMENIYWRAMMTIKEKREFITNLTQSVRDELIGKLPKL